MKISTILDHVDLGGMALPEFQRGYVWNRSQVRAFMLSLYRRYPVGSLLVWATRTETVNTRGDGPSPSGTVKLILDGQQRVTSLYGVVRGRAPAFFDGQNQAFTGLYFNVKDEAFEFYSPSKMRDDPHWFNVTDLFKQGVGQLFPVIMTFPTDVQGEYMRRINSLEQVKDIDLHVDEVTGEDKTIDIVVDIFNRVNSGGTKLSQGDLALAKMCAQWGEARQELHALLARWKNAGFKFDLDWLMRNITAVLTGQAQYTALKDTTTTQFQSGLKTTERICDNLLIAISGRLGLDHDRVLGARFAFPVMSRYLHLNGGRFQTAAEQDAILFWYLHSLLWGRFAGSVETTMNQDIAAATGRGVAGLLDQLQLSRGDLTVKPEHFRTGGLGARFYPLLYLLTRVGQARDWGNGVPLRESLLGRHNSLEVHHIFPKARLRAHGYNRSEINSLANFCFLTKDSNLVIRDKFPERYLPAVETAFRGAVASQWVPMDRDLWHMDRYRDFLKARQELLAQAANEFLDSLRSSQGRTDGQAPEQATVLSTPNVTLSDGDDEALQLNEWLASHGLPEGVSDYEIVDAKTQELVGTLDLAWPNGLQAELSDAVGILLEETDDVEMLANHTSFRLFTDIEAFKAYVLHDILATTEASDDAEVPVHA